MRSTKWDEGIVAAFGPEVYFFKQFIWELNGLDEMQNIVRCTCLKSFRMHWKYPRLMFLDFNSVLTIAIQFILLSSLATPFCRRVIHCGQMLLKERTLSTPKTSNPIKNELFGVVLWYSGICTVHRARCGLPLHIF